TFLINKIKNLIAEGYQVSVFSQASKKGSHFFSHYPAYPSSGLMSGLYFMPVLLKLFILNLGVTYRFYQLSRKEKQSLFQALKSCYLNAHILTQKLDWLHYEFATLVLGREYLAKAMNAKCTVSIRGYDMAIYPLKNKGCYDILWRYMDQLHTISDDLARLAHTHGLKAETPVYKITPAIDTEKFTQKVDVGVFSSPIKIISIGRLNWIKGVDYQIQSAYILKQLGVAFTWSIVGDGIELERCKFLIHQYQLDNEFILMGKKSPDEIIPLLHTSDVYIQYSHNEGFCNAVLEAQSCGLIAIVSDAGALPENVIDKRTGFVVPKRNPEALAHKIKEVSQLSVADRKEMANFAAARVRDEFDLISQSKKFVQFYQS
ncbi:MAG: glycosyltransferase family 4 protein, partial [Bacteroidetes bacterium]|nr:glycosyltransferase family 4 protein [Bacteroidota bacterium]